MFTLYKKELKYYLNNPIGFIVIALFSVFANLLFVKDIFVVGSASMRSFFSILPWLFMIFIPAISMRSLSEEKRSNTIEVLLTLPISETQIVLAKFFSLLTLVFIALILTIGLPISLSFLSKIYYPEIIVGYAGSIFLASSYLAICLFFSSQTKNQVIAFLSSTLAIFLLLVLSSDFTASILPGFVQDFFTILHPNYYFLNFVKGVVDFRSVVYFSLLSAVFIFLTIIELEKRG